MTGIFGQYPTTRLRRLRAQPWIRDMVQEYRLHPSDLIWPLFIHEEDTPCEVSVMPGVFRLGLPQLEEEVQKAADKGIQTVALFPVVPPEQKNEQASEALNPDNLVCRAAQLLKKRCPHVGVMGDIALDPYTSHGHDGLVKNGRVLNDETIDILIKMSLLQAEAGFDILAPSDMMDGRIGAIRQALEAHEFQQTLIMAYSAKYASAYYGPFRGAIGSASHLKGDKKGYQMNPANGKEALQEMALDIQEGADMVMVKPGMPYLDIIKKASETFQTPLFAYQVSGEYTMLELAFRSNVLDETKTLLETLLCFKRAGCAGVLTYFAPRIADILHSKGSF